MSNQPHIKSRILVAAFEKAVRAHEMMGAQPPQDWPLIEANFKLAKERLLKALSK